MDDDCREARTLPLTQHRTLVCDVAHYARQMPMFPVEREFDLTEVVARRAALPSRIAWSVLFMKAYALVAARRPELRRAYLAWPWPHFVEWPASVGMLAVNRSVSDGDRLCWARFPRPEQRSLVDLQARLARYQAEPIEQAFRRQWQLSRLPTPLRRAIWWWNLYVAGASRAARLGTFSLSSLAGQGCLNRGHPTVLTSSLTYGPVDNRGRAVVTLLCDHRVLDGVAAAGALQELETALQNEICSELAAVALRRAA